MLWFLGKNEKDQSLAGTTTEKNSKKEIHRCASSGRKFGGNASPLLDAGSKPTSSSEEKSEVHNAFYASIFTGKDCSRPLYQHSLVGRSGAFPNHFQTRKGQE